MKIHVFWTDISGYMSSCWRAMSRREGVDVRVAAYDSSQATAFSHSLMEGVNWLPLNEADRFDASLLARHVHDFNPDVVILAGWLNPAYRSLASRREFGHIRFFMGMDTPWRGTLRQHLARYAFRGYLSHIDVAMVTGERCWQYARRLGFPEAHIRRGVYGVDYAPLSQLHEQRLAAGPWPRQFLFAGRYAPEKGLDVLLDAYARYARAVENPWPLVCCGQGPLAQSLRGHDGVVDRGFLQPHEVHAEMVRSGAFILPSRYDPWPLALVESSAAGLPVICSNACGSAVEIVRDGYSGFTCATGDAGELQKALLRVHHAPDLAAIGGRARDFAAPYSAEEWATRWLTAAGDACREKKIR